jgi:5-methylcytosine-specific restriction endonuclease McrA
MVRRSAVAAGDPVRLEVVGERDGWLCGLCEAPVDVDARWPDPRSASIDHVVPVSVGGEHTYGNVQLAHLACNMSKGARLLVAS